jgi:hypothetical protein
VNQVLNIIQFELSVSSLGMLDIVLILARVDMVYIVWNTVMYSVAI